MKTFKLVSLEILEESKEEIDTDSLPLIDGLIINREDEKSQWLIEAYLSINHWDYFQQIKEKNKSLMLYAKISKPTNKPAPFLSEIVSLNQVEDKMNIIFKGTLVDEKKEKVENVLKKLINEGFQGEELLEAFMKEI